MSLDCIQVPVMAFRFTIKHWLLTLALAYIAVLSCRFGKAEDLPQPSVGGKAEDLPQPSVGGKADDLPQPSVGGDDPSQIVAKALLCFNDKLIYSSCDEEYRLNESGNLHVPPQYTDQYCTGSCLTETHLVLNCIDNIFLNFEFYNKATIQDVRDTIQAGCGHGSERGDFNVAQHIQAEKSGVDKIVIPVLSGLVLMIIGHGLVL